MITLDKLWYGWSHYTFQGVKGQNFILHFCPYKCFILAINADPDLGLHCLSNNSLTISSLKLSQVFMKECIIRIFFSYLSSKAYVVGA